MPGQKAEDHCRAECSAGAAVRTPGDTAHRVARGVEAADGPAADMKHTRVAVGSWSALGAHRADRHRYRVKRRRVDGAERFTRGRRGAVVAPVAVVRA